MKQIPLKKRIWINALFAFLCVGLLFFLYLAPEETTSSLPEDETHLKFHRIESKKEAEKSCLSCHGQDEEAPLPEDHPDPFRCLFCHKR